MRPLLAPALFIMIIVHPCFLHAGYPDVALRFPQITNPNPIAGRLYLQVMDAHDDRVLEGLELAAGFGAAIDYNVFFVEKDGDKELTVNSNVYYLSVARSVDAFGKTIETGGTFQSFQDIRDSWEANLVKHYHRAFSSGFGQVPPSDQYYGGIGNHETPVIGNDREFYLHTLKLYVKYPIFSETDGAFLPDLAVKLSGRIPLTGKHFDTWGWGLSFGASKQITPQVRLIGAAGLVRQNITAADFNADNLSVDSSVWDLFGGAIWDMGEQGGWYAQAGIRYSSERVKYILNPESADGAVVAHFGPVYRIRTAHGRVIEFFATFNEDIPGLGHGLEPDVAFFTGIALYYP